MIENSYASVVVSGVGKVGGLVGANQEFATIKNSYSIGAVSGATNVGGLIGSNISANVTQSFWDKETSGQLTSGAGTGKTTAEMMTPATYTDAIWDTTNTWDVLAGDAAAEGYLVGGYAYLKGVTRAEDITKVTLFASGTGTVGNTYKITNWTQLQNINYNSNVLTGNYFFSLSNNLSSLTSDYTTLASATANSTKGWNPIGNSTNKFKGTFDGLGHTISNLYINDNTNFGVGLFGVTNGATIQNIGLLNVNITANGKVGTLVGDNSFSTIKNSYAIGEVTGRETLGGLVGNNYTSTIENSYATVEVIGETLIIGGLVGRNNVSSIKNSYAIGEVTGNQHVGGLVGYNEASSTIENSYATGKVVGIDAEEEMMGDITVKKPKTLGGLVGFNIGSSIIKNSYATGDVSGDTKIGGLVGSNWSTITTSYSTGKVTGTSDVGGLVGYVSGGTTDAASFWDTQTSGQTTSAGGGTGKTTAEMQNIATYNTNGWTIAEDASLTGYLYPVLVTIGGATSWKIASSAVTNLPYTLSEILTGYTYNGTSQLPTTWTASSIFGATYNTWVLGVDYNFMFGSTPTITTGFTNAGTYAGITVDIIKSGFNETATGSTIGKFVIAPKALTVSGLSSANKVYDATTTATTTGTATLDSLIAAGTGTSSDGKAYTGDTISVVDTALQANFNSKNVADASTVSFTGLVLDGAQKDNYTLASHATASHSITPKGITSITGITASNKTYDGTTTATLVTTGANFTDMISGDILTVATAAGAFADKEVGTAKNVNITGLALGGTDAGNYNLTSTTATTTADITAPPSGGGGSTPPTPTPPTPDPVVPTPDPVVPTPDPVVPTPDPVVPTPDPVVPTPDPEPAQPIDNIITSIVNGVQTQVTLPTAQNNLNMNALSINAFTAPTPAMQQTNTNVATNLGLQAGSSVQIVSIVSGGEEANTLVSLSDIKEAMGSVTQDVTVPLASNSIIDLINGGVRLPDGVEQLFLVVEKKN